MANVKMKIKKGDQVIVTTGASKGAKGEVLNVDYANSRVLVQGVNMRKKHKKPTQQAAGGIETIEAPLHVSNVSLVDPKSGDATRVGYKTLKDGKKVRFAKKSGETIE
jgi:large subunit ribosomal protein L24